MVGSALVVTTGAAVLNVASIGSTPEFETTVIDLVLPDPAAEPDHVPDGSRLTAGAGNTASPGSFSARHPVSQGTNLSAADPRRWSGRDRVSGRHSGRPRFRHAESPSDRVSGRHSHKLLEATIEDSVATSSSQPVTNSPDSGHEVVPVANAGLAPNAVEMSSVTSGTIARADVEPSIAYTPAHRVTVSSGDSLYLIFKRLGLPQRDLALMTGSKPLAKKLAKIAPRQEIEFYVDTESRLTRLVHRLDQIRSLHVSRDGNTFTFEEVVEPPEVSVATATGVIDSSLFEAGQRAGLSDNIIMQMAEIFGWDVDFALDIRAGDRFALVFEEQFKDGKKIDEGPIVAAEFTNRGRRIRAVRYVDPTGHTDYFSEDGRSMRKAFLRTPVNFTRISSRFSLSRRHPILHKMRAHRGVDYAAPRGTAVKASGDGRVVFAGRKGGYGRTVVLQHGSTYTTLYAHLSRFSKGVRPGKRVDQGQTIGYVGSTGLATGPHLHYEFRVRGAHRDPLKVKLPQAAPLAEGYVTDFREQARPLLAKLELIGRTSIATAD